MSFVIYHNFPADELTPGARATTERIFLDCFSRCDKRKCHKVTFAWVMTDRTNETYGDLDIGLSGGDMPGANPTRVGVFLNRNPDLRKVGANFATFGSSVSPRRVREQAADYDIGLGVAIAHETGFHGIGRFSDVLSDAEGFVDSRYPPSSGVPVFRDDRCQAICRRLDLDTE